MAIQSSFYTSCHPLQMLRSREVLGVNWNRRCERKFCENVKKKRFKEDFLVDRSSTGRSILSIHKNNLLFLKTNYDSSKVAVYDFINKEMKWEVELPQQKALHSFQLDDNGFLLITFQEVALRGIFLLRSFLISAGQISKRWSPGYFLNSYRQLSDSHIFFWEMNKQIKPSGFKQPNIRENYLFVARNYKGELINHYPIPEEHLSYNWVEAKCFDEYIVFYSDSMNKMEKENPLFSIVDKKGGFSITKELHGLHFEQKKIKSIIFFDDVFFLAANSTSEQNENNKEAIIYSIDIHSNELTLLYTSFSSTQNDFVIDSIYVDERHLIAVCSSNQDFLKKRIMRIERNSNKEEHTNKLHIYPIDHQVVGFEAILIDHHFMFCLKNNSQLIMQVFDLNDSENIAPSYEEELQEYEVCGFSELGFLVYLNKEGQVGLRDYRI